MKGEATMSPQLRPIFIADDSPEDVELTVKTFQRARVANPLVTCRDGAELLQRLGRVGEDKDPAPLVILLDVKMPRMDGVEALREIRAHPDLRAIPVIMLTSSRQHRDLLESYGLGANAYVVKPLEIEEFRRAIESISTFWALTITPPPDVRSA